MDPIKIVILILTGPQVLLCKKFLRRVHPKVHLISGPPTGPPNTKPKRFCVLYASIADDAKSSFSIYGGPVGGPDQFSVLRFAAAIASVDPGPST